MKKHCNKKLAKLVKVAIKLSTKDHNRSGGIMLTNAGVPYLNIDMLLYEPHNVRYYD